MCQPPNAAFLRAGRSELAIPRISRPFFAVCDNFDWRHLRALGKMKSDAFAHTLTEARSP
jgi:hypothetical protein